MNFFTGRLQGHSTPQVEDESDRCEAMRGVTGVTNEGPVQSLAGQTTSTAETNSKRWFSFLATGKNCRQASGVNALAKV